MEKDIEEEDYSIDLGDRVIVVGGRLDGTRGRIYYLDPDLIRILPDGVSDRLVDIKIIDGDIDPELGIEAIYGISKRATPSFVAQIDAQTGYLAETFSATGEPGPTYMIREVNEANDTMVIEGETGDRIELEFIYGIPLDQEFAVLRPREPPSEEAENAAEEEAAPEEEIDPETAAVEFVPLEGESVPEAAKKDRRGAVLEYIDLPPSQRSYSDFMQREDAIQDFMSYLSVNAQKNPRKLRDIRKLVEQMMILRNDLIAYTPNGDPQGRIPSSFQTIAELLEQLDVPLSRPVLDVKKTVFIEHSIDGDDIREIPGTALTIRYLDEVLKASNLFLETQMGGASEEGGGAQNTGSVPPWYLSMQNFLQQFMQTWSSQGDGSQEITFQGDKEFFRAPAPREDQDPDVDGLNYIGSVGKLAFSYMKGLGPRFTRLKTSGPQLKIESGEEGSITNQLLFPLSTERDLGTTRSGNLAKDIAKSQATPKSVSTILEELGGIPAVASAANILSIGIDGNTSGNISIEDWIRAQPLLVKGVGEALYDLKNMGLVQKELTVGQQEVLVEKIKTMRAIIRDYIKEERERAGAEVAGLRLENAPFLQGEALEEFFATITTEPSIAPKVEDLKAKLPAYTENDLALFAGLSTSMSDLLMAALAGVPGPLARERTRYVRDQFIDALRKAMMKMRIKEMSGEIPKPIRCIHVTDLEIIQKSPYNEDRMKLLIKFLARYKKEVKDNWVMCSQGNHRLMCYHEALLLQEYAHPREKERIHKELLLNFSGGVFHGRYMCKNCGQPIADLDFDMGMEFDDEGRPTAGRGALATGEEGITPENIEKALEEAEQVEELRFESDTQTSIYQNAKEFFHALGISPEREVYVGIIERVESEVQKQPSKDEYSRAIKARLAKKDKTSGPVYDYDDLINIIIVCSTAANVLIEIQTHIPDFIPRYRVPGCAASFSGFPFGSEKDMSAVQYISCAVAGVRKNIFSHLDKKRQEDIFKGVTKMLQEAIKTAAVQQKIVAKRAFLEKVYGSAILAERLPERVPPRFKPVPYAVSDEEAAEVVIVPQAATTVEAVRAWIQVGHRTAKMNGSYIQGSPFSEASCCYTKIDSPRGFWSNTQGLPDLPKRRAPQGQQGSQTMVHFKPRRLAHLLTNPPEDLFYRVFLKVCYTGPRMGLPHEVGYTHKCVHCGFVFPSDPYIPNPGPPLSSDGGQAKTMFKEWQSEMDAIITRGKSALEAQKVVVTKATFEEVLDATHRAYKVEDEEKQVPITGMELLKNLLRIEPEPFMGWRVIMGETLARVNGLTPDADELEVANAYGPISEVMVDRFAEFQRRLGPENANIMKRVLQQNPGELTETLRTYILMPITRLLVGFKPDSLFIQSAYELPEITKEPLMKILKGHFAYLDLVKKHVKGQTAMKLQRLQKVLQMILPILQDDIREDLIPGGPIGLSYVIGGLVLGMLEEFINPNIIPDDIQSPGGLGAVDSTARIPTNIMDALLSRINVEGIKYTAEEIKKIVAKGAEDEKLTFISQFARLDPEQKKMALRIKRLGLKEWALGGTAAVRTLDTRILEREKARREEMGITDALEDPTMARLTGLFGEEEAYGGDVGGEGGYDVAEDYD